MVMIIKGVFIIYLSFFYIIEGNENVLLEIVRKYGFFYCYVVKVIL